MARWRIVPRLDVPQSVWDQAADTMDEAWLWHRYAFQDCLGTWPNRSDRSFAVLEGDRPVLLAPLHLVTRRVAGGVAVRRLDMHGGPAVADDLGRRGRQDVVGLTIDHLQATMKHTRALGLDAVLPPLAPAWRANRGVRVNPLTLAGLADRSGATWVIDLTASEDELWSRVQSGTRAQIRDARRAGVTVRAAAATDVDAYYALHVETLGRSGLRPHPRAYIGEVVRSLVPTGKARLLLADYHGVVVAGLVVAMDKGGANFWMGASSDAAWNVHANDLLQWTAIETARGEGCVLYDSGDAQLSGAAKQRGISDFKRKFGGILEPLFRARMTPAAGWPRLASRLLDVVRP